MSPYIEAVEALYPVHPAVGYPSPPSPVKPGKGAAAERVDSESESVLSQAMARMHSAQADAIFSVGGGVGGGPGVSFGAVYAALLDRFKWGVVIAIAVCVAVLLSTAVEAGRRSFTPT